MNFFANKHFLSNISLFHAKNTVDEFWFCRNFAEESFSLVEYNPLEQNTLLIKRLCDDGLYCFCPEHFCWERILEQTDETVVTSRCNLKGIKYVYLSKDELASGGSKYYSTKYYGSDLFRKIERHDLLLHELSSEDLRKYIKEYKKYLNFQKDLEERKQKSKVAKNFPFKVHKDVLFYRLIVDSKNLTLILEQYSLNRMALEKEFVYSESVMKEIPFLVTSEEYDVKNGVYRQIKNQAFKIYSLASSENVASGMYYPDEVYECCMLRLQELTCKLLNRKINFMNMSELPDKMAFSYWWMTNHRCNKTSVYGMILKAILYIPYEPRLFFEIMFDKEYFAYDEEKNVTEFLEPYRFDPNCYYKYCEVLGIKTFKSLRKIYLENYSNVLRAYKYLCDFGFKDVNIIQQILKHEDICSVFHRNFHYFKDFFTWIIPLKGEKASWNLIKRTVLEEDFFETYDGRNYMHYRCSSMGEDALRMFCRHFENIDYNVRVQILRDGFTEYNHDVLSDVTRRIAHPNVQYSYTAAESALEDEIDGFKFILPKDYNELVNVASNLHNCVASYSERIVSRESLIVYALKGDSYRLCIEVRNMNVVHQQRTDRNQTPYGEDAYVLSRWRTKHNLIFFGNRW